MTKQAILITFFLSVLLIFSNCSISKNNSKASGNNFSAKELSMIMSDDSLTKMRIWKITNFQDSILLRKKSKNIVFNANNKELRTFAKRLYYTVTDSSAMGVGIAAPQVGILKNMIVVQRFDLPEFPFGVFINPVITNYSDKKQPCPEGCLSIPEKQGITQNRAETITVEYDKLDGTHHTEIITSFTAVVFQHEIDHLNGILFIDHLKEEAQN